MSIRRAIENGVMVWVVAILVLVVLVHIGFPHTHLLHLWKYFLGYATVPAVIIFMISWGDDRDYSDVEWGER